ncbi:MAG: hypothetical protein HY508_05075, partial [Acidobacteria bacterium]|nr:hypothetical protein [Acidobacteriota bacterium]
MMSKPTKFPGVPRLAFVLGGLATLVLVAVLLWAGFTTPLSSRMPVPSPDGRYFAYFNRSDSSPEREGPAYDLIIARPEGNLLGRIPTPPGRIIWSNANHLVTLDQAGSQVTIIANADNRFVQLTRLTLRPRANPQWASDGNKLACVLQLDGGQQLTIYDVQQPQTFPVPLPANFRLNDARLIAWSPGSEQLYFLNAEDKESVVYGVDVRQGAPRELVRGRLSPEGKLPQISPDGTHIFWGQPENAIMDLQTGSRLWTLPAGAHELWWPWSGDSSEFYFAREETPGVIFSHSLSSTLDQAIISGARDNGFFDLDGINYFFREPLPVAGRGETAPATTHRAAPGWRQAGRSGPLQALEGVELWPWERTLDGLILARRDDATRVRYGLFDPETHRLDAFSFPTDDADYLRQVKSFRLVLATVALFAILAAVVFWTRSDVKSGRAFPILLFLAIALGCGGVVGSLVSTSGQVIPYRITLAEIGNQGWGISSSLPQLVLRQAQTIMTWLWALLPLAILNFALSFPDRTLFLKSRDRVKWILYGIASLPLLVTALARFVPNAAFAVSPYITIFTAAFAACVWALSLGASHERPPDKA